MRPIYEIAREIRGDWPKVNYAAAPYLDAMRDLGGMHDRYGFDSAQSVVSYFLANAAAWRGPVARRVKLELRGIIA